MHAARDVREGDALVDAILEEGDGAVASVVEDAQTRASFLTLASVAEDCSRLQAVLVNTYQLLRPDIPVDARRGILPERRS